MAESGSRGLRAWWRGRRWSDEKYIEGIRKWQRHGTKARIACAGGFVLMMVFAVTTGGRLFGLAGAVTNSEGEARAFSLGFWAGAHFGLFLYGTLACLFLATVGPFGQRAADLTLKLYDEVKQAKRGDKGE